jgi:periplasmic protein TonB
MRDTVFKAAKPTSRRKSLGNVSAGWMREAEFYNRSSLAVEFDPEASAPTPLPHLVPKTPRQESGVPDSPLWKGLDPLAREKGRSSRNVSFVIHVVVIAGIVWWGATAHNHFVEPQRQMVFKLYAPPISPVKPVPKPMQGGGGGGAHQIVEPRRAHPPKPKIVRIRTLPPQIARVETPKVPVPPSMQVKLPTNDSLPKLGMPHSPQVAVASQGAGSNSGFGLGMGGGLGAGQGDGAGSGADGGYGGGVMNVGGGVSAPQVIHSVDPQFTPQARQADYQGTVSIQLIVDANGNPRDIHVVRHLHMGLDEKAVEAVRQYKFKPAMYKGHPVAVQMIIDVAFNLH